MSAPSSAAGGIFALHAMKLRAYGLTVLPCDGKVPLVKGWNMWQSPPSTAVLTRFASQFPNANIAILPGPSNLLVVDVDDISQTDEVVALLGETPLQVTTSRGVHFYFRDAKISNLPVNLKLIGLNVDLKGGHSIVIVPPSQHESGAVYRFLKSNWDALARLPTPNLDALRHLGQAGRSTQMRDGSRKQWLNDRLCSQVSFCETFDALLDSARTLNEEIPKQFFGREPLLDDVVTQRAQVVWNHRDRFEKWFGQPAVARIRLSEIQQLTATDRNGSDAIVLLATLRAAHGARGARGESFALVTTAMEREGTIPGWHWKRYSAAIKLLLHAKFIVRVRQAFGKAPAQYLLGRHGYGQGEGGGSGQVTLSPDLGEQEKQTPRGGALQARTRQADARKATVMRIDTSEQPTIEGLLLPTGLISVRCPYCTKIHFHSDAKSVLRSLCANHAQRRQYRISKLREATQREAALIRKEAREAA